MKDNRKVAAIHTGLGSKDIGKTLRFPGTGVSYEVQKDGSVRRKVPKLNKAELKRKKREYRRQQQS
jgi:hypothetical protein